MSIGAWVMAQADLQKMDSREMDPQGYANTRAGRVCGIIGTVVGMGWGLLLCFGALAILAD